MALLEVDGLTAHFHTRDGIVRAVDGVSYRLEPGETLGVVGESGSGKSVAHLAMLGLIPMPPGRIESGTVRFDAADLLTSSQGHLRQVRGKRIAMIFQDPMTALNPYLTIGEQVAEPLRIHEGLGKSLANKRAIEALEEVGIQDAARRVAMYPHEFSGGMRQRVMIAMALITRPDILIADEPTTALDVTVQAQILELIKQRQEEIGMAVVLITHDMGVVAGICDRVLVMYAGRIVEEGPVETLFAKPRHPYTEALLASLPAAHRKGDTLSTIPGAPPDLCQVFAGCPFAPRCIYALEKCHATPVMLEPLSEGRATSCLRVQEGEI
ncbi:MAG: ABC transporter ATP-binding protein [Candidatus Hydrogenedentes bacterium]|nr:ABC transporter ATP-binding protein [Candidatus Hydrogenedentota bacterium]